VAAARVLVVEDAEAIRLCRTRRAVHGPAGQRTGRAVLINGRFVDNLLPH
jgi:hypothetical protein